MVKICFCDLCRILVNNGLFTASYWRWMPVLVLIGYWALFTGLTFIALQYFPGGWLQAAGSVWCCVRHAFTASWRSCILGGDGGALLVVLADLCGFTTTWLVVLLLLLFAAPQQGAPLFSEDYLAERELNRTGAIPPALQKSNSSKGKKHRYKHKGKQQDGRDASSFSNHGQQTIAINKPGSSLAPAGDAVFVSTSSNITSSSSHTDTRDISVTHSSDPGAAYAAAPAAAHSGEEGGGLALPFEPLSLAFRNISYFVDLPPVSTGVEHKYLVQSQSGVLLWSGGRCADQTSRSATLYTTQPQHKQRVLHPQYHTQAPPAVLPQGAEDGVVPPGGGKPQLQLLHEITGSFRPGVLTALMGVSGEQYHRLGTATAVTSEMVPGCVLLEGKVPPAVYMLLV